MKKFIEYTNEKINDYVSISNNLIKYKTFNQILIDHQTILNKYYNNLITVNTDCITLFKIKQIGSIMKYFYDLKYDKDIVSSVNYMFYFHGYLDNIQSLKNKITKKQISFCEYTDKPTKFKNSYYGILDTKKVVKFLNEQTFMKNGFCYNKKTKKRILGVILVHTFGNLVNIDKKFILECKNKNIKNL